MEGKAVEQPEGGEYVISDIRQKRPRLRLGRADYDIVRRQVLERDGWRCQVCGKSANLQVHHELSRARLGHDDESNLITLCGVCHKAMHERNSHAAPRS